MFVQIHHGPETWLCSHEPERKLHFGEQKEVTGAAGGVQRWSLWLWCCRQESQQHQTEWKSCMHKNVHMEKWVLIWSKHLYLMIQLPLSHWCKTMILQIQLGHNVVDNTTRFDTKSSIFSHFKMILHWARWTRTETSCESVSAGTVSRFRARSCSCAFDLSGALMSLHKNKSLITICSETAARSAFLRWLTPRKEGGVPFLTWDLQCVRLFTHRCFLLFSVSADFSFPASLWSAPAAEPPSLTLLPAGRPHLAPIWPCHSCFTTLTVLQPQLKHRRAAREKHWRRTGDALSSAFSH